jgi:response regulator RpfG family c-di-GMP phosphodiesterase
MELIILIDDDQTQLRRLDEDLKGSRYRIISTFNCKKGFEYARSAPPDLIILGLHSVSREGIEILISLKKEPITKNTIILGIVKEENPSFNEYLKKIGITTILENPYTKNRFVNQVNDLIQNAGNYKKTVLTNTKSHTSISLQTDDRIVLEFRSGIKNYVLPEIRTFLNHEFIKSILNKHISIDIRTLPEMSSEEIEIFEKILKAFGEKKIAIISGPHMGNIIRNSDISDNTNLFLSMHDYELFLENPDLDE